MVPLEAPQSVNREIVAFVESLDAPPRPANAADGRKRPLLRHVLDRLARIPRRHSGSVPR